MSFSEKPIKVSVYRREPRAPGDKDVAQFPYQADIIGDGFDHHGVGSTADQALLRATTHWVRHENTRRAQKV